MKLAPCAHSAAKRARCVLVLTAVLVASCNAVALRHAASGSAFQCADRRGPVNLTVFTEAIVTGLRSRASRLTRMSTRANRGQGSPPAAHRRSTTDQLILDDASYTYIVSGTSAAPQVQVLIDRSSGSAAGGGHVQLRISNAAITTPRSTCTSPSPGSCSPACPRTSPASCTGRRRRSRRSAQPPCRSLHAAEQQAGHLIRGRLLQRANRLPDGRHSAERHAINTQRDGRVSPEPTRSSTVCSRN